MESCTFHEYFRCNSSLLQRRCIIPAKYDGVPRGAHLRRGILRGQQRAQQEDPGGHRQREDQLPGLGHAPRAAAGPGGQTLCRHSILYAPSITIHFPSSPVCDQHILQVINDHLICDGSQNGFSKVCLCSTNDIIQYGLYTSYVDRIAMPSPPCSPSPS